MTDTRTSRSTDHGTSWDKLFAPSKYLLLFFLNSLLLTLAWHSDHTAFLVLAAFVPLFYLLHHPPQTYNERLGCYIFAFFTVFLATYFTVYWIRTVSPTTHFITTLARAITMFLPYLLTLWLRFNRKTKPFTASLVFIASWIVIELLHDLNILGLPYGNLGHPLAAYPRLIQWYSITGSTGGTLWILAVNLALAYLANAILHRKPAGKSPVSAPHPAKSSIIPTAKTIRHPKRSGKTLHPKAESLRIAPLKTTATLKILTVILLTVTLIPMLTSLTMFAKLSGRTNPTNVNVVALHTGSDVYDHKYNVDPEILLLEYLNETKKHLDPSRTNLIIWPENAITGNLFFNDPDTSSAIIKIRQELHNGSQNILIAGAIAEEIVPTPDPTSYAPNILFNREKNYHFKLYNAAVYVQPDSITEFKVKKRLVPLSEQVPTGKLFAPLIRLVPNLAELNFSAGEQGYPLFAFNNGSCRTTPIICYGAAFSNYVAGETRNTGSNFIAMIFNEGWMKSQKAYTHFHWFALCRTIENRRFMVKASNEGITAVTDHRGSELGRIGGTANGVVKGTLSVNDKFTFYTRHHRLITMVLLFGGLIFILTVLITHKVKYRQR